jgi:hypothetical protein
MTKIKYLITGARAPAALQLARILGRSGHEVVLADSMAHSISYKSKWVSSHVVLPPPALQFSDFVTAAKRAVAQLKTEIIICTCEEIFYWAKAAELDPAGFAPYRRANPPFKTLRVLHHKGVFARLAKSVAAESGVQVPVTRCFGNPGAGRWVCKPAFSRFAVLTRLGLSAEEAGEQIKQPGWIAQQQVAGREFCTWAFFVNGKEVCAAAYQPVYRAGKGSGIGLRAVEEGRSAAFARNLASRLNYTGQLAFDWIENDSGCHVLECNPRSTSGIHFLDCHSGEAGRAISHALDGAPFQAVSGAQEDLAVKWAMLMFGALRMLRPRAGASERVFFMKARDVERDAADPLPSSGRTLLGAFCEITMRAIKLRSGLLTASTADIEWNGNRFWENP